MPSTKYSYVDTVDTARLEQEIHDNTTIVIGLDYIHVPSPGNVDVWMKDVLPAPQETELDALVAAHVPDPLPEAPREVTLAGDKGPSGESRIWTQPNRKNFYRCDRDFLMKTAVLGTDSFEDLKVNPQTYAESNWAEMIQVGCYKSNGGGGFTPCVDQADADTNAILSVWDYQPIHKTTLQVIPLDFLGGRLFVDPSLTYANVEDYRLYAVMAPNIPAANGGQIPFFDGYLARAAGDIIDSVNPVAVSLDTDVSTEVVRLRMIIHYPAGQQHKHILQLVTYRPAGSW